MITKYLILITHSQNAFNYKFILCLHTSDSKFTTNDMVFLTFSFTLVLFGAS